ncbi:MAG: YciI family protein [Solirubrobacteraceae bacterium]
MAGSDQHLILFYEYVEDVLERRGPHRGPHLARISAEREAGRVVLAGALGDPPHGAAIVFRGVDRGGVEAFAAADPYVRAGLVKQRRVELWNLV